MIDKEIVFEYGDNNSEVFQLVHPKSFTKTAEYSQQLSDFIANLKEKADKIYALINALSAGEYYGSNRKADYFPEEALKEYHKTFEAMGHVYRHHINKDPERSLGRVIFSYYNPEMHRVELIVEMDKEKATDIVERLEKGDFPAVSMGCRVPWDECSICGNRAKSTALYCEHLTKYKNYVYPNGQKVYAINRMPRFFDISIVTIPADRTAGIISRISSNTNANKNLLEKAASMDTYSEDNSVKLASIDVYSEIKKNISAKIESISSDPKMLIKNTQGKLPEEKLKKLAEYPLNEVLSTMNILRIFPLKEDFQKLALYCAGKKELADHLEKMGEVFQINSDTVPEIPADVNFNNYNEKIANILYDEIPNMSLTKELVVTRALLKLAEEQSSFADSGQKQEFNNIIKYPQQPPPERSLISRIFFGNAPEPETTAHKNPILPLGILGSLYYGYAKIFNNPDVSNFRDFMLKNKWLLPVLIGAGTAASIFAQDKAFNKTAGAGVDRFFRNSLVTVPVSYYISGVAENKAKKGVPISSTENFFRKHPLLVGLLSSLGLVKAENFIDKATGLAKLGGYINKIDDANLNQIFIDLIN